MESFLQTQPNYLSWFIDIPQSSITVTLNSWKDAQTLVNDLSKLGFDATPVRSSEDVVQLKAKEFQSELIRLVIAGFCAGNIMSLSLSNYFGADAHFRSLFDYLSFALTLPALFYSAYPYYRGFWATLKTGTPSLEFPIALALFGGTVLSAVHLFTGSGEVYFDSITGLIFFLLASRFILNRMMSRWISTGELDLPGITFARELQNGRETIIVADKVKAGNIYSVQSGETLPCDGTLLSEAALLNTAILTGEPYAQTFLKNSVVFAGTIVAGEAIQLSATTSLRDSRFGKLLASISQNDFRKLPNASIVNKWAMWFSYGVLLTGVIVFTYWWPIDPQVGLSRVLALFMTSCPCALTFGFPLVMSIALKQAQKLDTTVQDVSVLSRMDNISDIYFDKTGTLTSEELTLLTPLKEQFSVEDLSAIIAIETKSHHPIAQALKKAIYIAKASLPEVHNYLYTPTIGVSATVNGHSYALKTNSSAGENISVSVFKNDQTLGSIHFAETLRPCAAKMISQLQSDGYRVHLLSGDSAGVVETVGAKLMINGSCYSGKTPEEKQEIILKTPESLMIGDGINDAPALASAAASIAMPGPIDKLHKVSSILFSKPSLQNIPALLKLGKFTHKATRRLALLSFSYNVIISSLAIMGYIHPWIAAILMPASSVVVILLVLLTQKEMQWKLSLS